MNYIGIDLAWTYKNDSGLALIDNEKRLTFCHAKNYTDEELIQFVLENRPCIVSIDAPLQVENETGGRPIDSQLMKTKINGSHLKLYATSRTYMMRAFKCIRGENIRKLLEKEEGIILGETLFETYPTGIYLSLFFDIFLNKYKLSSKNKLPVLMENAKNLMGRVNELGFRADINFQDIKTKVAYKKTEDQIDSILCAINSYYINQNQALILGDGTNGIISLPKPITFDQ